MEAGEYVRTPLGITKYLGKYNMLGNLDDWYEFDKLDENLWFGDIADVINKVQLNEVVIKSSPNIIDLIEKKDIIKYHFNGSDYISEVFEYKNDLWVQNEDNMFDISEINIKSIVTKEQFEAIQYEVK